MWTASDTWKGAGCSKSGAFDMNLQDFKRLTDEMVEDSINELKDLNDLGVIDPHSNYATGRAVYIISGDNDPTVPPENQDA